MTNSVEPPPGADRIREMLAREGEVLARVVAFVRSGMAAGRISHESGESIIALAEHEHRVSVRLLRDLLDGGPQ